MTRGEYYQAEFFNISYLQTESCWTESSTFCIYNIFCELLGWGCLHPLSLLNHTRAEMPFTPLECASSHLGSHLLIILHHINISSHIAYVSEAGGIYLSRVAQNPLLEIVLNAVLILTNAQLCLRGAARNCNPWQ